MKTKKFLTLLIIEAFILCIVCAYFLISSSDIYRWYVGSTNFTKQDKNCDLQEEACSVTLEDGSDITLSINPRPIPLMKPIELSVKTKGINLDSLKLKVYATNMNMGLIEKSLGKTAKNSYEGRITLPTCIVGNMIWNVNIIANKPTKSIGATFEFKTGK